MADISRSPRSLPVLREIPPPPLIDDATLPSRPSLYWEMARNVTKKVIRAPISIHTWGALRRTVLPQILPDELLRRWKPYQMGECNRCGACCQIQFQCSFMVQEPDNLTHCTIYQSDHAPQACLNFPIDPLDLHMLQREIGNRCVFYYEGAPEPIPRVEFAMIVARHLVEKTRKSWKNRKRRPV
ncbi:MAG: hypothetical protein IT175_10145, partial [Acidobacteria bacterium]|nr:hypothetical protein [Acidobacteriota bacterium]